MKLLLIITGMVVLALCGLAAWLAWPGADGVWRMDLHLPFAGPLGVRVDPVLRFSTTRPGLMLLNRTRWRTAHGVLALSGNHGVLQARCAPCTFSFPALAAEPVRFDALTLTLHRQERHIAGLLTVESAGARVQIPYAGRLQPDGVTLDWVLPRTATPELLAPLRRLSPVLRRAQVTGSLAAAGTLEWPSRRWSAEVQPQGLGVSGLGTEALRYGAFTTRCQQADGSFRILRNGEGTPGWLPVRRMGRWLPRAVIIAEDDEYMHHPGYSLQALQPLLASRDHERQRGGSTLTQQLAKNFFTGGERTWLRKLEELLYAVEMERTLGKRRILALYLNSVHWGPGVCGAEAAARTYFGRRPSRLKPAEAAWLAGILRNPHRAWQREFLTRQPDHARLRQVLRYMPRKARRQPVVLRFATPPNAVDANAY